MPIDDERDPDEETPLSDSSAADATPDEFTGVDNDPDALDADDYEVDTDDDEVEIDDPDELERATERVFDAEDDDLVEEPTDAELAQLTEGSDATAKAADQSEADADRELVEVGAGSRRSSTAKSTNAETAGKKGQTEKKGRATAKRDDGAPVHKRTGPVTFVKESVGELRKVVYPTGPQLLNYFVVVLIFVLFIIAVVSVLDLAFGWAILKIFT